MGCLSTPTVAKRACWVGSSYEVGNQATLEGWPRGLFGNFWVHVLVLAVFGIIRSQSQVTG